jgi:predicted PurR-regulated permease PerM
MKTLKQNRQLIGFFLLLGITSIVVLMMLFPLWQILALAGIFAVIFHPLYERIERGMASPNMASVLTILIIILVAILPLWFIGQLLFNEIVDVYNKFRFGELVFNQADFIARLPQQVQNILQSLNNDINAIVSRFTGSAFNLVSGLLSNLASFFLSLFLLIFILFFFLRDGIKIKGLVKELSPLSEAYDSVLMNKLETAVGGVLKGSFLIALIQGTVASVGFVIFGVPQPVLWGAFTVLTALVPTVGTSISLIPAILYLFFTGHTGAGIGMAIWGAVAVGTIDNIVGPRLVGEKINLHPLLVLLSVLGGIQLFGFLGFLFGPILMSVFVALLDIYRKNLKAP